mmetsp:Transcript_103538/g.281255  ORF Transcript_103538/g.281255 Transcript_103538/m.281255 type:complete len:242 (-) Transcript_103538:147-872(-)
MAMRRGLLQRARLARRCHRGRRGRRDRRQRQRRGHGGQRRRGGPLWANRAGKAGARGAGLEAHLRVGQVARRRPLWRARGRVRGLLACRQARGGVPQGAELARQAASMRPRRSAWPCTQVGHLHRRGRPRREAGRAHRVAQRRPRGRKEHPQRLRRRGRRRRALEATVACQRQLPAHQLASPRVAGHRHLRRHERAFWQPGVAAAAAAAKGHAARAADAPDARGGRLGALRGVWQKLLCAR